MSDSVSLYMFSPMEFDAVRCWQCGRRWVLLLVVIGEGNNQEWKAEVSEWYLCAICQMKEAQHDAT